MSGLISVLVLLAIVIGLVKIIVRVAKRTKEDEARKLRERRQYLMGKYGNEDVVNKIIDGMFWQGQTIDQLLDSIGKPEDIDKKVYKSKTKETWKYGEIRRNQFSLRIFIENGIVIGWEQK